MPLRDHFSPTWDDWCQWHGFTVTWACHSLSRLNLSVLSDKFRALLRPHKLHEAFPWEPVEPTATVGEGAEPFPPRPVVSGFGPFAEPTCTDLYVRSDVYQRPAAWVMWANPEFAGSAAGRRAFAVKVAAALQAGASVVTVNAVTDPPADLHAALGDVLGLPVGFEWRSPTGLSAVAYRVARVKGQHRLDVWTHPLAVGETLPTVPLWLEPNLAVPLDLEAGYEEACRTLRIE